MQLSYGVIFYSYACTLPVKMSYLARYCTLGRDLTSTTQVLICVDLPFLYYVRSRSQRALLHRYFVCTYKLYSCAYISLC